MALPSWRATWMPTYRQRSIVESTLAGGVGALAGDLDVVTAVLVLADFEQAGRAVRRTGADRGRDRHAWLHQHRSMVARTASRLSAYWSMARPTLITAREPLTRIRWVRAFDRLILNDSGATDLEAYFEAGGAGADLTISIQNVGGVDSQPAADAFAASTAKRRAIRCRRRDGGARSSTSPPASGSSSHSGD